MDQMKEKERMLRTCSCARLTADMAKGISMSEGGLSLALSPSTSRSVIDTWLGVRDKALPMPDPLRDPAWDPAKLRTLPMLMLLRRLLALLARLMVE